MVADNISPIAQSIEELLGAGIVAPGSASDAIDGLTPEVVASPSTIDELRELLSFADREGLAVAPRGGGTQLALGNRMKRLDAVADLSGINRIIQHNAADLTLVAEAGMTLNSLREILSAEGQFLALDAPLTEHATIGGTLAAGVSGPLKWQYGSARDLVIGMKVAQADGRITQSGGNVVKNVSGYDMARLHVGGLGTLGIITEVSFKLTPMPRQETTLVARFSSAVVCLTVALRIFNSGVVPIAMTMFSGDSGAIPEVPMPTDSHYALAVRLGGRPRTLRRMENDVFFTMREQTDKVERLDNEAAMLWSNLADFGYADGGRALLSARITTLPGNIADVAEAVTGKGATIVAQPGYGMMNAHWFDADLNLSDIVARARRASHRLGGSLIVEQAPLDVKDGLDVWDYTGESLEVMRRLKAQYDPNGTLNPNRFTGGI